MAAPAQASNATTNGHIQGDVDLAAGVAVGPGVLLGAAPGCRLVISAGVCLGADAVVQARHGDLVLELGVSLGSGVLVVGHGSIGPHTCVGANSTVINPSLGASQVVAPGSLVGDPSQASAAPGASPGSPNPALTNSFSNGQSSPGQSLNGQSLNGSSAIPSAQTGSGSLVYGKTQVNRLLATLFPHRQSLNGATPEDKP